MNIKKSFAAVFSRNSSKDKAGHHEKRGKDIPSSKHYRKRKLFFLSVKTLVLLFLLFTVTTAYAQAPTVQQVVNRAVQTVAAPLKPKPKPLTRSDQVLSAEIQASIETLAQQQLKQEQANATLPFTAALETNNQGLLQPVIENIEGVINRDSADRARLKIKKINRLIAKLQRILTQDKSGKAIDQAVSIIGEIGAETDKIVADPQVQTDREILALQIEQYNRLQLIIQRLGDTLSFNDYLKIEDARQKYLVSTAVKAINVAPSLEAIHTIAVKEVSNFVGDDFAELKAIEIISDFEDDISPEAKQKLLGLEKELATSFEKKMLKLPRDVRNRKLQSYIHYSFGDPILQIRAFERMKNTLADRELILGVDSLKEVAIKRLTDRFFELETQEDVDRYLDRVIQRPQDIKVLGEMKLAINGGRDKEKIAKFARMEQSVQGRVGRFFNTATPEELRAFFTKEDGTQTDIIDVVTITNLEKVVSSSEEVSQDIKQQFAQAKSQTLERFVVRIASREFATTQKLSYNPVSTRADVRILLSSPQGIAILQNLRSQVPSGQRAIFDKAIAANSKIVQEHLLFQVNNPEIFADYQSYITQNREVSQALQRYAGRSFPDNLAKKSLVVQKVALSEKQQLYEIMQQITQTLFATQNNTESEKQLPDDIRREIKTLRGTLPDGNIPRLTVPEGVNLPVIASLPHGVSHAIVQAAKARIRYGQKSEEIKLDFTLTAKDLDIGEPRILPDSPLYPLKHFIRRVQLVLTFNSLGRAERLIKHNNERTLEAAKLLEKSSSRRSVDLALETLSSVEKDFNRLKANAGQLDTLKQRNPEGVDRLIDSIIKNGLARQTVFAQVEDKVYGADYVKVEKIRHQVLRDGIDALLQLSGGNAQILVEKLERAVNAGTGSQFKELKAIELLGEIKRFQPKKIDEILEASETRLVKQFEAKLLALKKEEREKELLGYAQGLPGNPVRQFEAYEELKEAFENKETLLLVQGLEDKAVENLTEIVSGITDEQTLQEFAREVVGSAPEDLKIILAIELQVNTPDTLGAQSTPIEQKIEEVKTIIEEEIVQEYLENPDSLLASDLLPDPSNEGATTISDVSVVQELVQIIEQTPEATKELIEATQEVEQETVRDFIETVTTNSDQALEPAPEVIETLVELKEETPPAVDAQIDAAIEAEVAIIKEYLSTKVSNAETLETYIAQIEESPVVAEVISEIGGSEFTQILKETTDEIAQSTAQEQTLLQETIEQVHEEIFSSPVYDPAPVEETLPETVQEEITQIKEEVPTQQALETAVTTESTVTVESVQTSTQTQTEITTATSVETQTTTETPSTETPAVPGL